MSEAKPAHVTPAFQPGKHIQLLSKATGQYLQRLDDGSVDACGAAGSPSATFIVHRAGGSGLNVTLQCVSDKTKYIRFHGSTVDGNGNGGPKSTFHVVKHAEDHTVSLQEAGTADDKYFLGVNVEGRVNPPAESGSGDASRFTIAIVPEGKFHAAASVGLSDGVTCRLESKASGKLVRFADGGMVDACGTPSEATTLFMVHAVGKGLAKVSLESTTHAGKFLRLKDGVLDCLGTAGDPWTVFRAFQNDDGTVAFHAKTKKKDDESKFFVGFDADGSVSNPELTGNDTFGRFVVVSVGHRYAAK